MELSVFLNEFGKIVHIDQTAALLGEANGFGLGEGGDFHHKC
jgi:hypothetical protein